MATRTKKKKSARGRSLRGTLGEHFSSSLGFEKNAEKWLKKAESARGCADRTAAASMAGQQAWLGQLEMLWAEKGGSAYYKTAGKAYLHRSNKILRRAEKILRLCTKR